jgi:hypothetical protein
MNMVYELVCHGVGLVVIYEPVCRGCNFSSL